MINVDWVAEAIDTIFNLLGKYGKWLNVRARRSCFIVWIVCCIYWLIINVHRELWSQALFTIPSIIFHFYGFYHWRNVKIVD